MLCLCPTKTNHVTHQTVKLWHRTLVSWVTNVPDLDTTLPSCVNVPGGVTDGNSTNHLSMVQRVDLTSMSRDSWAHQSIWGEWHWLHLSIGCHMKRVGTNNTKRESRLLMKTRMSTLPLYASSNQWHYSLHASVPTPLLKGLYMSPSQIPDALKFLKHSIEENGT